MTARDTQTRIRRLLRKRRKQAETLGALAEDQFERNLFRKFGKLVKVKRFMAVWLLMIVVLIGCVVMQTRALSGYYQTMQPAPGGIYHEGIIGNYTNANPLYVTGQVNDAVSKLIFASLFKYNDDNKLVGDLAESYKLDANGTLYTVKLRPHLKWHDGVALTAQDVVFTYKTIQNPDAHSPLYASWQNVVVAAVDPTTVTFKLPNPLSSFPHSLTTGIIPEHSFRDNQPANYRSLPFNTVKPVGAGPYMIKSVEVNGNTPTTRQEEIELVPFDGYHSGAPAISSFVVHTYRDKDKMVGDFKRKVITAMAGLQSVPDELDNDSAVRVSDMPLTAANMVFFKTTQGPLADKSVRQALVGSTDIGYLTRGLREPILPVREPFLPNTPGYDPKIVQLHFSEADANKLLDAAGWKAGTNGIRSKDGQPLTFRLYAQDTDEYKQVTERLKTQWRRVGADVQIFLQSDADLRSTVSGVGGEGGHAYDALLYGISLGVDPDEFVYWHSSQSDVRSATRLNLSEYRSPKADGALEDGRTRADPMLRAIKYKPFLEAWQQDAPALGLYQPRFLYITRGDVYNLNERTLTVDTDRYNNVDEWMVRQAPKIID